MPSRGGLFLLSAEAVGRESLYELNEPLLRLVLDIKDGGDQPLALVVTFLRRWYAAKELRRFGSVAPAGVREYYEAALKESSADTAAEEKGLKSASLVHHRFGRGDASLFAHGPTPERGSEPRISTSYLTQMLKGVRSILDRGRNFLRHRQFTEALSTFEEILTHFGSSDQPALLEQVAQALDNKGVTLGQLNRNEEEIAVYDEVVSRFGSSNQPPLLEQVAWALVFKGATLGQLNRTEEEIAAYDEVVSRFGSSDQPALRTLVADSLAANANHAIRAGDYGRAMRLSERALALSERHPESTAIRIRTMLAAGDASAALDLAEARLTESSSPKELRSAVARAVLDGGHASQPILHRLSNLLLDDGELLSSTLVAWIQDQLPMSEHVARKLEDTDDALHKVFGEIAECSPGLRLLRAVRLHALGDRKALFELPLEIRRLIPRESSEE